ncbi:MAG: peptidase M4, thermolysin, partial [bacterium P3]
MKNMKFIRYVCIAILLFLTNDVLAQCLKSVYIADEDIKSEITDAEAVRYLQQRLGLTEAFELREQEGGDATDGLGFTHKRYSLWFNGIKVEYADIRIHFRNNRLISANGEYINHVYADMSTSISLEDALLSAQAFMVKMMNNDTTDDYKFQKSVYRLPELVLCNNRMSPEDTLLHLCYKVDLLAEKQMLHEVFYIDANTGAVVNHIPLILHADGTAETRYSGNRTISTTYNGSNYVLRDSTRGGGIETFDAQHVANMFGAVTVAVDFSDNDNHWTASEYHNANKDDGALDAHWGAMMTYDYFKNKHGRDSYDGLGSKMRNYVHFNTNLDNAYWYPALNAMFYGDGNIKFDILTALDVIGHEIAHGVCQYSANLVYRGESGAINESLSDIWGACVENYAAPEKQTWLIGEEMVLSGTALRDMSNPKSCEHPDTYAGVHWINPSSQYDNGGVHINSGVMNHWFYLLSEGGSGTNDNGWNYTVAGITMDKAASIVYRAETVYMTQNTDFTNAREYTIAAASDLYGNSSQEVQSVKDAWYAVGVWADLYVRDGDTDDGTVPSNVQYMWNSPDIWTEDAN